MLGRSFAFAVSIAVAGAIPAPAEHPVRFLENRGQWDPAVRFAASSTTSSTSGAVEIREGAVSLRPKGAPPGSAGVTFRFEGACEGGEILPEGPSGAIYHFIRGRDRSRWITGVRSYPGVVYRGLYEGIDLALHDGAGGDLEYDLRLEPGADLSRVMVRCDGAERVALDPDGALVIGTPEGEIRQALPRAWEPCPGGDRAVACRYRILGRSSFGFEAERNPERSLIVDPLLSYMGGGGDDNTFGVAVAADDSIILSGDTRSGDGFPAPAGITLSGFGDYDVWVAKISPDGQTLLTTVLLGGVAEERSIDVTISPEGVATVVGYTFSDDFPVTEDSYQNFRGGGRDAFVAQLDLSADAAQPLLYATFIGGTSDEVATDVALDSHGRPNVTGYTSSPDFPTTEGAFSRDYLGGLTDTFFLRLDPKIPYDAGLLYSTYFGTEDQDGPDWSNIYFMVLHQNLVVEPSDDVILAGITFRPDSLPTAPEGLRMTTAPTEDFFIARLRPDGHLLPEEQLLSLAVIGGDSSEWCTGLALDGDSIVAVGTSNTPNLPVTQDAYQKVLMDSGGNETDLFVLRLSHDLNEIQYLTYLGAPGWDRAWTAAVAGPGKVVLAGRIWESPFLTTTDALSRTRRGDSDAFFLLLNTNAAPADQLTYSTYFGGSGEEEVYSVAFQSTGVAILGGPTWRPGNTNDFTDQSDVPGVQSTPGTDSSDGFYARFDLRFPTVSFSATPSEGVAPFEVSFDAAGSKPYPGTSLVAFDWDFGGGASASGATARHTFERAGRIPVRLSVQSDTGLHRYLDQAITVHAAGGSVSPWSAWDIGDPPPIYPGVSRLETTEGTATLRLVAGGNHIGQGCDQLHLAGRSFDGDALLVARFIGLSGGDGAQAGIMLRSDPTPCVPMAAMVLNLSSTTGTVRPLFLSRKLASSTAATKVGTEKFPIPTPAAPIWLRLERKGQEFIGSYSISTSILSQPPVEGDWKELARVTIPALPPSALGGIAASGKDPGADQLFLALEAVVEIPSELVQPALPLFRRGDVDGNGKVEVTDAIGILGHLFLGENTAWRCAEAADTDNDGKVDVTDAVNNLNFQFLGGTAPASPGPKVCGPDEGPTFLGCDGDCQ